MNLHGTHYTRQQILERIGNLAQIGGTRSVVLDDASSKGVAAVDVDLGSGFQFTVIPDRGMDISRATYKGINLVYQTPNGEVHPAFYEPRGTGWLRTFFGGLLTTCGLTTLGAPSRDGETDLGLHGRYSCLPARRVNDLSGWDGDEYRIHLSGTVEECCLFGDKIRLTRTIRGTLGETSLQIVDEVENFGFAPAPFMIMYHVNPGFPLLGPASRLRLDATATRAFDARAASGMKEMLRFSDPVPGWTEMCYLHTVAPDDDGQARAVFINEALGDGLGLFLRFDARELPYMTEWKMMGQGDYVVGIEPCNVPLHNRAELREKGLLPMLEPGETRRMEVEIGVLDGMAAMDRYL